MRELANISRIFGILFNSVTRSCTFADIEATYLASAWRTLLFSVISVVSAIRRTLTMKIELNGNRKVIAGLELCEEVCGSELQHILEVLQGIIPVSVLLGCVLERNANSTVKDLSGIVNKVLGTLQSDVKNYANFVSIFRGDYNTVLQLKVSELKRPVKARYCVCGVCGRTVSEQESVRVFAWNVAKELGVTFIDMNKITHDLVQGLGPVESKKLFMFVEPNQVPAFPKGREDNTHLNVYGARTIAGLAVDAIGKEIPELAKYIRQFDYVVAQDGSGDFFTVQEAINAVPDFRKDVRTTILIRKGTYKEKLIIPESKINISLIGEDGAILTYDGFANKKNVFGENMGTSGSSSCYIYAPDFYAENITFENSSGPVGQAVVCFVSADRVYFKNCRFLGFQDTLYTYSKQSRQYYEDCYIEGTVDFIFGWSTAVFNRCHIHSKRDGYVTAPSTDKGKKYGYVFYDCKLTAEPEATKVYLSRPWRPYAQAVFIRCELGKHILPVGWNNWGKKENEKTVFYAEYESRGEGANPKARAAFSQQLKNLQGYEITTVLAGEDGWNPVADGNKLITVKR